MSFSLYLILARLASPAGSPMDLMVITTGVQLVITKNGFNLFFVSKIVYTCVSATL